MNDLMCGCGLDRVPPRRRSGDYFGLTSHSHVSWRCRLCGAVAASTKSTETPQLLTAISLATAILQISRCCETHRHVFITEPLNTTAVRHVAFELHKPAFDAATDRQEAPRAGPSSRASQGRLSRKTHQVTL
jgi:hypothetical protein